MPGAGRWNLSGECLQDPADEDEQARVMSQAQALLDCVADLVVHCGVTGAVAVLQEGLQLRRGASWAPGHHSADSWRILGQSPSPDGPGDHLGSDTVAMQSETLCEPAQQMQCSWL